MIVFGNHNSIVFPLLPSPIIKLSLVQRSSLRDRRSRKQFTQEVRPFYSIHSRPGDSKVGTMDPDDCLNILEQRPGWSLFSTNIAWCFGCPETADITAIATKLQPALEDLASAFPWIAGRVVNEGSDPLTNNTGVFKIIQKDCAPQIIVQDHRQTPSVPSIQTLRQAGFATKLLDETLFAPRRNFSLDRGVMGHVLLVQLNMIPDGLILVFSGNHSAMDMPGLMQIARWFDKACRNEAFTREELEVGNMARRSLIPLLDSTYQPGDEISLQMTPVKSTQWTENRENSPVERLQIRWETFSFQSTAIRDLKTRATETRTSDFVSTDDAVTAFLWQSLARARLQRLGADKVSTLARACNARRFLSIPPTYPGLVQNTIYSKLTLRELVELPLGAVASILRDAVASESPSVEFYTRAVATVLSRSADKGCLKVAAWLDRSSDVLLSSFTATKAYEQDFGLGLGCTEAVRLTNLVNQEGVMFFLPAEPSGNFTFVVGLRHEDLVRLKEDKLFARYGRHVG